MIIKDYFINLSIFSLLVSAAIFIQVFWFIPGDILKNSMEGLLQLL